jgi:hypothetical protein
MGEFEKDIRDMFEDLELQIDTDQLWSGIENKLDKKDRKYPVWWIIAPVILLMSIAVYTAVNMKTTKTKTGSNNLLQQNDDIINNNLQQKDHYNGFNGINLNSKNNSDNKDGNKNIDNKAKKHNNQKNIINTKRNKLIATQQKTPETQNEAIPASTIETADEQNNSLIIANNLSNEKKISRYVNFSPVPYKFNPVYIPEEILYKGAFADYFERKPVKKVNYWSKSMDFSFGFALVDKNLKTKTSAFNSYLNKRITTENYLEAINSSIAFNLKHSSGFFITTGIYFTQIDERFNDIDSIDIYKENDGITKEIQNGDGTIAYLRGKKEVIEHITWDKIIYNYYSFIEIPVIIGYHFDIKNISLELNSGLSYNLVLLNRGQIIGTEGFPVDLATQKDIFKKRTGISFIAGMKMLFPIRKNIFFVEPNIKYNLQDITFKNYPLQQRYFNYGIKLGYRYSF